MTDKQRKPRSLWYLDLGDDGIMDVDANSREDAEAKAKEHSKNFETCFVIEFREVVR